MSKRKDSKTEAKIDGEVNFYDWYLLDYAEKKTEFGELVHSKVSRGVNSAYGIG